MDRKILSYCRDYRNRLAAVSGIGLCIAFCGQAFSQERMRFQMPTPEDMFRQNDRNGDGRLDPSEISSNPFLPRMLERSGLDTSRGISERDFTGAMDQARQNFERNGGGRQFGGDRGRGEDDDENEEGGRDRRRFGGQDQELEDGEREQSDDGDDDSGSDERKARPRVTIDLQADLVPGDTDRDGQLAFYEWRRWQGKSLSEFNSLDTNGDGFVTPREVALLRGPTPEEAAATATVAANTDERSFSRRRGSDEEDDDDRGDDRRDRRDEGRDGGRDENDGDRDDDGQPEGDADSTELAADAQRYFGLMDRDRDGSIAPDEWQGQRIRSMFEDEGIDLADPVSQQDFVRNYVRLSAGND